MTHLKHSNRSERISVYDIITERIIGLLEQGTVPWQKPWATRSSDGTFVLPQNFTSRRGYRGINAFLLGCAGFDNPYWLTFRQAIALGGCVRKGEKGMPVVFYKLSDSDESVEAVSVRDRKRFILRYFTVFNLTQCDGIALPDWSVSAGPDVGTNVSCEDIVASMPHVPAIRHGGSRAFYHSGEDYVQLPAHERFHSTEEYFSTLFHELVHSTGHKNRLNRDSLQDVGKFGDENYSKEELIAEMGATFLCAIAGVEQRTLNNSAAYLAHWLKILKADNRILIQAGAAAQRAVDLITNANVPEVTTAVETE